MPLHVYSSITSAMSAPSAAPARAACKIAKAVLRFSAAVLAAKVCPVHNPTRGDYHARAGMRDHYVVANLHNVGECQAVAVGRPRAQHEQRGLDGRQDVQQEA